MELRKIEDFAKSRGFQKVEYMGKYKGMPTYSPLRDRMAYIGKPFFILVDGQKLKMVTGNLGLKILHELNN